MTSLPVLIDGIGSVCVADPDTGSLEVLSAASDHAIAHAAEALQQHDSDILGFKRALAAEMRSRHGVGKACVGGYELTVSESQSWPIGAVSEVLSKLMSDGLVTPADIERCLPLKPKANAVQLKALIGRLTVKDPEAAKRLAEACTLSPTSLREIRRVALDEASA